MKDNAAMTQTEEIQELQSNSPHSLISQALAQGAGIDTLERLMALQEKWEKNQARKAFFAALSKFQADLPEIKKTKKVNYNTKSDGTVQYNYSDLATIVKAIKPYQEKYGLSYRWEFVENGNIKCTCIVSHVDGHSETTSMEAGKDTSGKKNEIQSIGSTRQYLQRYTLIAGLGLSTAEDDNDGKTSKAGSKEWIPEPKKKVDWKKLIKNCETFEELSACWERMTEKEKEAHKDDFTKIKENIMDAEKKEKGVINGVS